MRLNKIKTRFEYYNLQFWFTLNYTKSDKFVLLYVVVLLYVIFPNTTLFLWCCLQFFDFIYKFFNTWQIRCILYADYIPHYLFLLLPFVLSLSFPLSLLPFYFLSFSPFSSFFLLLLDYSWFSMFIPLIFAKC